MNFNVLGRDYNTRGNDGDRQNCILPYCWKLWNYSVCLLMVNCENKNCE